MYPEHRAPRALGATLPATPALVLQYRVMWNDYVMSTACALLVQAWAFQQVAAGKPVPTSVDPSFTCASSGVSTTGDKLTAWASQLPAGTPLVDLSQFAMQPPSADALKAAAQIATDTANNLETEWNLYHDWSNTQLLLEAGAILQSYQTTVLDAGQNGRPILAKFSPQMAAALPQGADTSAQAQLIAGIEGAQLLASGLLDVIETGVGGAITGIYSSTQWAAQQVEKVTTAATSWWLWATVGVVAVAGAAAYVVWKRPDLPHPPPEKKPATAHERRYVRMMQKHRAPSLAAERRKVRGTYNEYIDEVKASLVRYGKTSRAAAMLVRRHIRLVGDDWVRGAHPDGTASQLLAANVS